MNAPSKVQLAALVAIADGWKREHPPTIRELGAILGHRSTNATADVVTALLKKGLAEKPRTSARLIRLTRAGKAAVWAYRVRTLEEEAEKLKGLVLAQAVVR